MLYSGRFLGNIKPDELRKRPTQTYPVGHIALRNSKPCSFLHCSALIQQQYKDIDKAEEEANEVKGNLDRVKDGEVDAGTILQQI